MKCLVLRLRAVARSVFTVTIPLINWLALGRLGAIDRYLCTGRTKADVYVRVLSGIFHPTESKNVEQSPREPTLPRN